MANHKSALKRIRQNEIRRVRNRSLKTRIKTVLASTHQAVGESDPVAVANQFKAAQSTIDRAVKKGAIHKRTAARKISRLSRHVSNSTE